MKSTLPRLVQIMNSRRLYVYIAASIISWCGSYGTKAAQPVTGALPMV